MRLRCSLVAGLAVILGAGSGTVRGDVIATFDDLPSAPATDAATGLQNANGNSLLYKDITWDSRFTVVGDEFRESPSPNPLFGLPHSGHYFVTNDDGDSGLTITTNLVLTGAWFGRNEYFGFGGGADQITIVALSGGTDLASVVFDLPETHDGQPEPLSFVDTSVFAGLSGITGYRIDRRAPRDFAVNWVADDFQFTTRAVPEPGSLGLMTLALPVVGIALKRRRVA